MCDIYRKAAHSHATGIYQSLRHQHPEEANIVVAIICYLITAISLNTLSSLCSCSRADALSDGIIVFSGPLSEAECQKQQDKK